MTKKRSIVLSETDLMNLLREQGWLVVLKCLPKQIGWLMDGGGGEYDQGSKSRLVGKGKWVAEAQWMGNLFPNEDEPRVTVYNENEFVMDSCPRKAVTKLFFLICEQRQSVINAQGKFDPKLATPEKIQEALEKRFGKQEAKE